MDQKAEYSRNTTRLSSLKRMGRLLRYLNVTSFVFIASVNAILYFTYRSAPAVARPFCWLLFVVTFSLAIPSAIASVVGWTHDLLRMRKDKERSGSNLDDTDADADADDEAYLCGMPLQLALGVVHLVVEFLIILAQFLLLLWTDDGGADVNLETITYRNIMYKAHGVQWWMQWLTVRSGLYFSFGSRLLRRDSGSGAVKEVKEVNEVKEDEGHSFVHVCVCLATQAISPIIRLLPSLLLIYPLCWPYEAAYPRALDGVIFDDNGIGTHLPRAFRSGLLSSLLSTESNYKYYMSVTELAFLNRWYRWFFMGIFAFDVVLCQRIQDEEKKQTADASQVAKKSALAFFDFMAKFAHVSRTALTALPPLLADLKKLMLGSSSSSGSGSESEEKLLSSPSPIPFSKRAREEEVEVGEGSSSPSAGIAPLRLEHHSGAYSELLDAFNLADQATTATSALIQSLVSTYQLGKNRRAVGFSAVDIGTMIRTVMIGQRGNRTSETVSAYIITKPGFPQSVRTDNSLLMEVMANLISNSFKYTLSGHVVVVLAHEEALAESWESSGSASKNNPSSCVVLTVEDTGMGMSSEKLKSEFPSAQYVSPPPKFASLSPSRGEVLRVVRGVKKITTAKVMQHTPSPSRMETADATVDEDDHPCIPSLRVGLKNVVDIVDLLKGKLEVTSVPSRGSKISLRIPVVAPSPTATAGKKVTSLTFDSLERMSDFAKSFPLSIVVVEDHDVNRKVFHRFLSRLGYVDIRMFCDGAEFLDHMARQSRTPRNLVVLMDLNMPVVDGFEAIRCLRKDKKYSAFSDTYVAAVTATMAGGVQETPDQLCRRHGFQAFFEKPIKLDDLKRLLSKAHDQLSADPTESDEGQDVPEEEESSSDTPSSLHEIKIDDESMLVGSARKEALVQFFLQLGLGTVGFAVPDTSIPSALMLSFACLGLLLQLFWPLSLDIDVAKMTSVMVFYTILMGECYGFTCGLSFGIVQATSLLHGREPYRWIAGCVITFAVIEALHLMWPWEGYVSHLGRIGWSFVQATCGFVHFLSCSFANVQRYKDEAERLRTVKEKIDTISREQQQIIKRISHDLGNHVAGIDYIFPILAKYVKHFPAAIQGKIMEEVRDIYSSFCFIVHGVVQLVEYFRLKKGKMELILQWKYVHDLVADVVKRERLFRMKPDGATTLSFRNGISKDYIAKIDSKRVSALVENLVSNALKYTKLGVVSVDAWLELSEGTSFLHCRVQDTGQGMSEADISRALMEPFTGGRVYEVDPSLSLGFGLFVDQAVAQLSGGDLVVRSSGKGMGTSVHAMIQVFQGHALKRVEKPARDLNVLIVDDSSSLRLITERYLKAISPTISCEAVATDPDARAALRRGTPKHRRDSIVSPGSPKQGGGDFDVVFVDCNLGKSMDDGLVLVRWMRQHLVPVPAIIMMTADRELRASLAAQGGQFAWVMEKPFKIGDIRSAVKKLLY